MASIAARLNELLPDNEKFREDDIEGFQNNDYHQYIIMSEILRIVLMCRTVVIGRKPAVAT